MFITGNLFFPLQLPNPAPLSPSPAMRVSVAATVRRLALTTEYLVVEALLVVNPPYNLEVKRDHA